jgi:putative DNA primase/helicase
MINAAFIASALQKSKQNGSGWMACCPAHDDHNPSLSISDGEDGKVLVKCFAGCDQLSVIDALKSKGLWPEQSKKKLHGKHSTLEETQKKRIVETYDYCDRNNNLVYQIVRREPKSFPQRRPDGKGGWIWDLQGVTQFPYRFPDFIECDSIVIVEGEKDVDRLWSFDIPATCNAMGAGKWPDELNQYFTDKEVFIIPDNDDPGRKHAELVAANLKDTAASVKVCAVCRDMPDKADVSDWLDDDNDPSTLIELLESFPEWVLENSNDSTCSASNVREIEWGSDVELAQIAIQYLEKQYGQVVYVDGRFHYFDKTHWPRIESHVLRKFIHQFDGADSIKGKTTKLNKSRIDSIIHEMSACATDPEFFFNAPAGINAANGFIQIDSSGNARLHPHSPDYRQRHVLPGNWSGKIDPKIFKSSHLYKLLEGSFKGDSDATEKEQFIQEVIGVTALGHATKLLKPKAIIFIGPNPPNGKSQFLDLCRGVLPPEAICSIPLGKFNDEKYLAELSGKYLNVADELTSATSIVSDTFKQVVTGEPISARSAYKHPITFQPIALHIFATNVLPSFKGGMDRGVQRRLYVLSFNRTIPENERTEHIGTLIRESEADLLLDFAVEGACRVVRQRYFSEPASSKDALCDWIFNADSVLAWLNSDAVEIDEKPEYCLSYETRTKDAYTNFRTWATSEGFGDSKLPQINNFSQRVFGSGKGIQKRRDSKGPIFIGLKVHSTDECRQDVA